MSSHDAHAVNDKSQEQMKAQCEQKKQKLLMKNSPELSQSQPSTASSAAEPTAGFFVSPTRMCAAAGRAQTNPLVSFASPPSFALQGSCQQQPAN